MALNVMNGGGGIGNTNSMYGNYTSLEERDLDEKVYQLNQNESAFVKLLALMNMRRSAKVRGSKKKFVRGSGRENCHNPKFEWLEQDCGTPITQVAGSVSSPTTDTNITVTTGEAGMFQKHDLIYNQTHPEVMKVVSVSGDVVTVQRAVGESAVAGSLTVADKLVLLNSAWPEGSGAATPQRFGAEEKMNYCQIFKKSVGNTNTSLKTRYYGDIPALKNQKRILLKQFLLAKSRAYYVGQRSITPASKNNEEPTRTTGGLDFFIQSNIVSHSVSEFDYGTMIDFLEMVYEYDDEERIFLCNPKMNGLFQKMIAGVSGSSKSFSGISLEESPITKEYGINVTRIKTTFGPLDIVMDKSMAYLYPDATGFALNMSEIEEMVLRRDIWIPNVQERGVDSRIDQYLCETGLKVINEKHHAKLIITA